MEVHDGNIGDRGDGRRLLRVVRNHPRRRRVPVSGVLMCAKHTRGDELGKEGRGSEWGGQDTCRHMPTGAELRTGDASPPPSCRGLQQGTTAGTTACVCEFDPVSDIDLEELTQNCWFADREFDKMKYKQYLRIR